MTLPTIIGIGIALLVGMLAIATVILKREFSRWSESIDRIPSQEWFDEVKLALNGLAGQAATLSSHTASLLDMQERVGVVEDAVRGDHDMIVRVKSEHDLIRSLGNLTACGTKLP